MLELREYTKAEMTEILGNRDKQGIDRKLRRLGIEFDSKGRGERLVYNIKEIPSRFKVFCVVDMGVSTNADFAKLRNLFYYTFCGEGFAEYPVTEMRRIMAEENRPVSRQTISKWHRYLQSIDYINMDKSDCIYYAITKTPRGEKHYKEISKELYSKGWAAYWETDRSEGTGGAYYRMYNIIGGHPCKRPKIIQNAFYKKELEMLIDLVNDEFLK